MDNPKCILLLSGKRKSGKDYFSEKLKNTLKDVSCIVRISEPIKSCYAQRNHLDLTKLMGDGPYKEKHRLDMILWSEKVRSEDPGYFCKEACSRAPKCKIWIVSDIRRKTDIKWFRETYRDLIITVRIFADETVRKSRGYVFTEGVDNTASECDLDDVNDWSLTIDNSTSEGLQAGFNNVLELVKKHS